MPRVSVETLKNWLNSASLVGIASDASTICLESVDEVAVIEESCLSISWKNMRVLVSGLNFAFARGAGKVRRIV